MAHIGDENNNDDYTWNILDYDVAYYCVVNLLRMPCKFNGKNAQINTQMVKRGISVRNRLK